MFVVFGLILLIPSLIILQIFRVNFVEGENLRELWSNQAINYINIPAQRGNIYDTNGSLLATNTVAYKIAIDPHFRNLTRDHLSQLCSTLATHTNRTSSFYMNKVRNAPAQSRYVVLERSIDVNTSDSIRNLNIPGVILEEEYKRSYSFGSLASHTLGFVNHTLNGMIGLENYYQDYLKGEDGLQQVRRDRVNRIFAYVGAPRKTPIQGYSLHTTINSYVQAILEEELEKGIRETRSNYGTGIVINPKTGAIKALANYPTFDPNNPASTDAENRRNFAISDIVEPGSTFKLVTAIAAVEQGVVNFEEEFETPEDGVQLIHGQAMRDHDPLGTVNFTEAVAQSSNIAVSEIAMRLSPRIFYQYARNLGFGTPTYVDLPNEEAGRLPKPIEWSQVTLPWMSIGYEAQVTPLQILQAYAAFGNKGMMMRPYIVDKITDEYGKTVKTNKPMSVRRIARKATIDKLLPVFEEVVSDSGTAEWAAVDGLSIAGKTGTAQKYMDGRYQTAYRASFVGFFPSEDPEYAILIMLDEPKSSIYGGYTAGQIFRQTAARIAGLDNEIQRSITPDQQQMEHIEWTYAPSLVGFKTNQAERLLSNQQISYRTTGSGSYIVSQNPEAGEKISDGVRLELKLSDIETDSLTEGYAKIPNLRDKNMRQATTILSEIGLNIQLIGSGTIYTQFPQPGEIMQKGRTVTVRGKARPLQQASAIVTSSSN